MGELLTWVSAVVAIAALAALAWSSRRAAAMSLRLAAEAAARRTAEELLAECEGKLELIFECQPECMKFHTEDGTIQSMNPAGLAMVDAESAEQVVGTSVYKFIAPEFHDRYRATIATAFSGRACSTAFRLLGLKGTERMIETHVVPLRNPHGQVVAAMALTRDVTKCQDAEERAQRHLTELARVARVASMGEMASGIAHELNQPLTAIATYAGACLRRLEATEGSNLEVTKLLAEISAQARRAGQIIRNIRGLVSRSEPSTTAVDINEVVRMMVSLAEPEAKHNGVVVRMKLEESVPLVCARRIEIEQVVFNLLKNAIEAMGQAGTSGPEVLVSTQASGDEGIEISVRDSGPGIPAPDLNRVFDPFYTTKTEGMGMGLSISRSIIEAHRSHLSVRPNADRGVTFRFTLPIARTRMLKVAA